MKRIIIILFLCCTIPTKAVDSPKLHQRVRDTLNHMFTHLDKYKIPTGLLLDYAVDLVDFSLYDGTKLDDSNLMDILTYKDVMKSIASCDVKYSTENTVFDDILESFQANSGNGIIPISVTAFKYNYIKANAIEDNLIHYDESTGYVIDKSVNGVWQNPYSESAIIAFVPNTSYINSLSTTYNFPSSYLYSNLLITRIEFDAGDGNGYRYIWTDSPIDVTYNEPGEKHLRLRISATNGKRHEAHTIITVEDENSKAGMRSVAIHPDENPQFCYLTSDGTKIKAQMSCYYKTGGSSITKPFIVVEGFDPWILENLTLKGETDNVPLGYTNHQTFYKNWAKNGLKDDYDLIYIDWENYDANIKINALLLKQIIEHINQKKRESGSIEKNVVMGQSMGGLIARFALRSMEIEGIDHDTSKYISHDAPHLGANVPLGALYFIHQVLCLIHGFDGIIGLYDLFTGGDIETAEKHLYNLLHSDSVKQMLLNYVNEHGILDNSFHEAWQSEFSVMGFPKNTENIAIVNGRHFDKAPTLTDQGNLLHMTGYANTSLLSSFIVQGLGIFCCSNPKFDFYAEVNPLSSSKIGKPLSTLDVNYVKKFLWKWPIEVNYFSSTINMPTTEQYFDDYPGSQYLIEFPSSNPNFGFTGNLGDGELTLKIANAVMFIPTASALAIKYKGNNLTSIDYERDYFTERPSPENETPFAAYYLAEQADSHININASIYGWISNQINAKIEGPSRITSSAEYTLTGYDGPIQWKSSDITKATIDDNGILTVTGNGDVTISAESYLNGQLIRKTKSVKVGAPTLAISYTFSPGSGHMFYVSTIDDEDMETLNELVNSGDFQYEWSILCNEDDMITSIGTTPSITILPEEDATVTVCLRLIDNQGNKGETYSRTIDLRNPFSVNYKYVEINSFGTVRFIKNNGYETGFPSEDFMITFRNIAYSSSDNSFSLVSKYIQGNTCYLKYLNMFNISYLTGSKILGEHKWKFNLFDTSLFVNALQDVIERAGGDDITQGEIIDFNLSICNHNKKVMQRIPFAIIYR